MTHISRFDAPRLERDWSDYDHVDTSGEKPVLDGSGFQNQCFQFFQIGLIENDTISSEDCLYLDIFVPKTALNSVSQLPVYLYFHGGGFHLGSKAGNKWVCVQITS